ncbi:hypothetical protein OG563_26695 [Nocardia vinacea]|uniref:Uncharacterized protein n=1 Tax=Nocardia vinacea TaxID=96468 RepID=A0ABZ1YKK6_9NOCA|nr:hypothetical protein [Nocardia vinacea]
MSKPDENAEIAAIQELLKPVGDNIPAPEDPPHVDHEQAIEWVQGLLSEQTGSVALTQRELREISANLHVAAWNVKRFAEAVDVLERIVTAVTGDTPARARVLFTELPGTIDMLLGALSTQTLVSVTGLRRMVPGVLTSSELDQLREQIPYSSIRDAFRENIFQMLDSRRAELAESVPPWDPPSDLGGAFRRWPSLDAVPTATIGSVLSTLSHFCGIRIVRVSNDGFAHLRFVDPNGVRFYEVDGGLEPWLSGRRKSPGSSREWFGNPTYDFQPNELVETGPNDYLLPDLTAPGSA